MTIIVSDEQWQAIHNIVGGLPDEAKAWIERILSYYHIHKSGNDDYQKPSESQSELLKMQRLIGDLIDLFNEMGPRTKYALIDTTPTKHIKKASWRTPLKVWRNHYATILKINKAIPAAQKFIQMQQRVKPGTKSFAIDTAIKQLDDVLFRYQQVRITRSKQHQNFLFAALNIVQPDIAMTTIEASIKRLVTSRKK